jgi:hypothetical protein
VTASFWKTALGRRFTRFYPLAIFVIAAIWIHANAVDRQFGDEWRYLWYARNILRGYYTPSDNEMIWNGPAYPLLLTPFVAFDVPLIVPKLLNAVFFALAVRYLHRTLLLYCSPARATLGGLVLGLSPLPYQFLHLVYTEALSTLLLAATVFHFCASRTAAGRRHAVIAGICLSLLIQTKVSFGPVTTLALVVSGALYVFRRTRTIERALVTTALAFALCLPWLSYTYSASGKLLYWSSAAGSMFYFMTSPHAEEKGDWFHHGHIANVPFLREHHKPLFDQLRGDSKSYEGTELEQMMPGVGRTCGIAADSALWRVGLEQLRAHPLSYLRNWAFNVTRLFFNFPYTLYEDIDWRLLVLHAAMLAGTLWVGVQRLRRRVWLPAQLEAVAVYTLVCTALSTVLAAVGRYFLPLYPLYLLISLAGTAPERKRPPPAVAQAGPKTELK